MSFTQTDVTYLRPNKTIEYYKQAETGVKFSIYNYEGFHFRLFQSSTEKMNFFSNGIEPEIEFNNEEDLDKYLESQY